MSLGGNLHGTSGVRPILGLGYFKKKKRLCLPLPEVQGSHPTLAVHLSPQDHHYLLALVDQGSQVSPGKEHSSLEQWRTDGTPTIVP